MDNLAYNIGWNEENIGKRYHRLAPCGKHWLTCSCGSTRIFNEEKNEIGHSCPTRSLVALYIERGESLHSLALLICDNRVCYGHDENIAIHGNDIVFKTDPRKKKYRMWRHRLLTNMGR